MQALAPFTISPNVSPVAGFFVIDPQAGSNTVTINGTAGDDNITVIRSGANTLVTVNSMLTATIVTADTASLVINGLAGNDNLKVDGSGGPVFIPITFDGGTGTDTALLTGTCDIDTYTPGPLPGAGSDTLFTNAVGTQFLNFVNTETLLDDVTAQLLDVIATGANDAINYSLGGAFNNHASGGLVSVNNLTPIEFVNKVTLQIDAGAGDDTVNLNNPSTPAGLTGITVNGGDPTASDTLIVNGTSAANTIGYTPSTTIGAGTVTITSLPTVNFTTVEQLKIDGQGGGDALTVTTPSGFDTDTYTPGATQDSGTITINGAAGNTRVPLAFSHLGDSGSVTFANAGGTMDTLIVNGTANSDRINVVGSTGTVQITDLFTFSPVTNAIKTPGVGILELNGLAGDDNYIVSGPLSFALLLDGGDPSASDALNLSGASGAVAVTLGDITSSSANLTTITGFGNSILLSGIEIANINAGNNTVTTTGTMHNDSITVTPTASNAATLTDAELNTVFNFSNVSTAAGGFAINGNGGNDQLFVVGTQIADSIDVNTITANAVRVNAFLVVNYNASLAHLEIDALAGNDTIDVTPSTATTIFVDGGDPIGSTPGDSIHLHPTAIFSIEQGPQDDEGGMNTNGRQRISWDHIEGVVVIGGGSPGLILGTNGDDIITIIARDATYNLGANGVQDFTVSVNQGPDILFIDTPNLLVDALAGNDQIHVQEPAPNNAVWNTQIFVAGGTPSAGTGNVGDTIVLETPGTQNVTYAPDPAAAAIPVVAGVTFSTPSPVDTAQFVDTTSGNPLTYSTITAIPFLIPGFYLSSPGGVEQFVYQGDSANDNLTYLSPANGGNGNTITYIPGVTGDKGAIAGMLGTNSSLVPLVFQGVGGVNGGITFNSTDAGRHDVLNLYGTSAGDAFAVGTLGSDKVIEFTNTPTETETTPLLTTTSINELQLFGLGGPDSFNIQGGLPYLLTEIQDSDPVVNLSVATGAVTVNIGNNTLPFSNTTVTGYGGTVVLIGVDIANLNANGNTVTVNGTAQPDAFVYSPTNTNAGTVTDSVTNTVFNFSNISAAAGAFTIDPASGSDTVTVNGTSSADNITATRSGTNTTVQVNGLQTVTLPNSNTESLVILSGNGNDNLTVDSTTGPVTIPIVYDGGAGTNALTLTGGTATADSYTPGSQLGSGTNALTFAGGNELVNFLNLAPIFDLVAGPLTVYGTNAANAINYIEGFSNLANYLSNTPAATWGQVSIDSYEPIEFMNKTSLTINALAGSDQISLNNPNTPTGLTSINVNGGDPTTNGDTLIVSGTTGTDAINYSPSLTIGSGAVQVNALPTVNFTTIEQLNIDGQGGNDALTVTTPTGTDTVTYNSGPPGSGPDTGSIGVNGSNGNTLVPLSFSHLGNTGSVTLANAGGALDIDIINGTPNSDAFTVLGPAGTVQLSDLSFNNIITVPIKPTGAKILELNGQNGDDAFNLTGGLPWSILIDGGDPSASDSLNITGATGPVSVTMANPAAGTPPTSIQGYNSGPGTVVITGVEIVNMNTGGNSLTVNGNQSPNSFTYTPTGPSAGTFYEANINTVFNFTNTTAAFTINGTAGSTSDSVTFIGTASRDLISIDQGLRTATLTNVANVIFKTVTLGPDIQVLNAQGLAGQDTFLVTPAPGTQFPQSLVNPVGNTNNLLINVDGGGNSSGENNALVLATPTGGQLPNSDFVVVNRGAEVNSGTVRTYGGPLTPGPNVQYPDVNYVNIQTVSPFVGTDQIAGPFLGQPNLLILGPDLYEPNQNPVNGSPFNAAFLGSGPTINVQNVAIFPNNAEFPFVPADQDYYRVVAQNTGTLDFQVYFNLYDSALFPAGGNLNIQVLDVNGNIIATGAPANFGSVGTTMNARIRIPVVQGQTYYLRVFGANTDGSQNASVVNGYNFTVVNTALAAPGVIDLSSAVPNGEPNAPLTTQGTPDTGDLPPNAPPSDSGRDQFDNVTNGGFDTTASAAAAAAAGTAGMLPAPAGSTLAKPTIYIWVDDSFLLNDIPGNPTNGGVPGTSAIPINFNSSTTIVPTGSGNFRVAVYDGGGGAMTQAPGTSNNPSTNHTLDPNDGTFIGFAQPVPGVPHLYVLTVGSQGGATPNNASDTLDDGTHNITARIQIIDPSGTGTIPTIKTAFGPRSAPLQIIIDTVPPPIQFGFAPGGGGGLTPGSDSGVDTEPETFSDNVTNVTAPTFQGYAEANSIVRLYAQITNPANPNFGQPFPAGYVFIGETVAIPLDGTNAFPNGQWQLTSTVDLNDPTFFLRDGIRNIVATAEDLAGNRSPVTAPFQIEIDTNGPQITDVRISDPTITTVDGENLNYNLFGLKPDNAEQGPTPLTYAITINVQDLPPRFAPFLNEIAFKPELVEGNDHADGGITLIGDANGRIAFKVYANVVTPTTPGQPATGTIQLRFTDANGNPIALPDDRYTLYIDDEVIRDPAGNKLDGESNAQEPVNQPTFPTGNGLPGGNFTARFTIDSRPELGDFAASRVYIDANGNFIYDPQNLDFVNRDLTFTLQIAPTLIGVVSQMGVHDSVFAGNFQNQLPVRNMLLPADGFDKLAAYGNDPTAGGFRWLIDTNSDGVIDPSAGDIYRFQPTGFSINGVTFNPSGIAFAGNFDGNVANGDEVGEFDGTHFWLDSNHNYMIDAGDTEVTTALRGFPLTGDFNGDGIEDLATWKTDVFYFNFGTQPGGPGTPVVYSGNIDATINFGFPGVGEIPLAADMDGDGITDVGLWVPGRAGTVPEDTAEEFFLISNDFDVPGVGRRIPLPPALTGPNPNIQASVNFLVNPTNGVLNHPFAPTPLGVDLYSNLLDEFATPIVGNFDPPLSYSADSTSVDPLVLANDTTAPTSSVNALAAAQTSSSFTVSWTGQDNSGGSGIASYDVYVSDNGGQFTRWQHDTTSTSATFNGANGHTYSFLSVATDNAGNIQDTPTTAQATTGVQVQVSIATTTGLTSSNTSITTGQSVTFTARVSGSSGTPTGTVTFKDGTSTLATITLAGGVATYTNTTFAAGTHSITATYNPITPNLGSASTALIESVTAPAAPPPPPPVDQSLYINGTAGNDIITLLPVNAAGAIKVMISNATTKNKAVVLGTYIPTGTVYVYGLAGNDTLQLSTATINGQVISVTAPISFSGGDGTDTLIAPNLANVWNITGFNSGTLNGNSFDTIENLTGGTSTDAFRFSAGGSVSGKINGATGVNTLDYSAYPTPIVVSLQTNTATGAGSFAGIQSIVASSGSSLTGSNKASAWNITGANAGNVGGVSFTGMSNLTGGTAADTFTFANGAGVSGKIDGGAGVDTLKYSAYTSPVAVNLNSLTATGAASIANIEGMVGGVSGSDALIGPNQANSWSISNTNTGKVNTFTFSSVENLTGGALNDNFVVGKAKAMSGHIDGGAGINMLDYAAFTTSVNVNLAAGTATNIAGGVSNISVVRGGSAADTITGDNGNDALIGGGGNDTLTAGSGHNLLFGGLGADTLNSTSGEDIMFAGTTTFDANIAQIDNLLAYWSRTDLDYTTRVAALKAGSVVGAPRLSSTTVKNDAAANKLNGGSGLDWFFAKVAGNPKDTITNQISGEQIN